MRSLGEGWEERRWLLLRMVPSARPPAPRRPAPPRPPLRPFPILAPPLGFRAQSGGQGVVSLNRRPETRSRTPHQGSLLNFRVRPWTPGGAALPLDRPEGTTAPGAEGPLRPPGCPGGRGGTPAGALPALLLWLWLRLSGTQRTLTRAQCPVPSAHHKTRIGGRGGASGPLWSQIAARNPRVRTSSEAGPCGSGLRPFLKPKSWSEEESAAGRALLRFPVTRDPQEGAGGRRHLSRSGTAGVLPPRAVGTPKHLGCPHRHRHAVSR